MKRKNKANKTLFPALIAIILVISTVFYIDFLKQSDTVLPILTKTEEELTEKEEETSAHTKPVNNKLPPLPYNMVILNTKTLKYHKADCEWAKKCRSCIVISKKEADKKGAKPCTSCL